MQQYFGVAVKCIIQDNEWKILLVYKSEIEDMNPNSFDIPWWRVNWWEKIEDAIQREAKEEVNLDIVVEKLSRSRWFTKWDLHLVGMTYIVKCEHPEHIQLSDEHTWYYWKTKEEILNWEFPVWLKEEVKMV